MIEIPAHSMNGSSGAQEFDPALLPFLRAQGEAESDRSLASLMSEHADPVIKQILKNKLRFGPGGGGDSLRAQVAEDVRGEIVLRLLRRLRDIKHGNPDRKIITDFRGYVAVTAYNACHEWSRQKYPQRWRLKNKLRYLLLHEPEFALWETDEHKWLCGFVGWRGPRRHEAARPDRLRELLESPRAPEQVGLSRRELQSLPPARTLAAVFEWAAAPLELDDLVDVVAGLWEVRDQPVESFEQAGGGIDEFAVGHSASQQAAVEQRLSLRQLWAEIGQLPPRQRAALLLNLKDAEGRDIITLLPFTRTASIKQVAEALEIPLAEFAALWNELPLDDAGIAARLGVTRQQVINLRKCARERLRRRLKLAGQDQ